jgi:hypothetical protein
MKSPNWIWGELLGNTTTTPLTIGENANKDWNTVPFASQALPGEVPPFWQSELVRYVKNEIEKLPSHPCISLGVALAVDVKSNSNVSQITVKLEKVPALKVNDPVPSIVGPLPSNNVAK